MSVIKYKIAETKRMSTDRDYFTTAGENLTTEIDVTFPNEYSTVNGWSQYVVFQLIDAITLADTTVTKAPKFSIPDGTYNVPNTLIAATITHLQFRSEKIINGVVNVFETEKKIFPRTSTSIVGVLGSAETLPGVYVTQDTLKGTLSTYIVAGTGIAAVYDSVTGKTTITAQGTALPGPHASSHAVGGLDAITPADIGAASSSTVATHNADVTKHIQYVIAGGVANAYTVVLSPVPTAYTEGMAFAVKINANTTGASTINANSLGAIAIKRGNGLDTIADTFKNGGVYTLRHNGINFILQGEGGEYGTAGAAQTLTGYTIGTDAGLVAGTMPNKSGGWQSGSFVGFDTNAGVLLQPPAGYYDGGVNSYVGYKDPNHIPANIIAGITVMGVVGNYLPTVTASTNQLFLNPVENIDYGMYTTYIEVFYAFIRGMRGTVRVSFTARSGGTGGYARIYKNGVAVGIERFTNVTTDTAFTEDFTVNADDRISLYTRSATGSNPIYCRNFAVSGSIPSYVGY